MLFLKKLDMETRRILEELKVLKDAGNTEDIHYYTLTKRKDLLLELVRFVNGYTWLRNEEAREKVRLYLKGGCDYKYVYDKYKGESKSSYNSIQVSIIYASKQLEGKLGIKKENGKDIIDIIKTEDNLDKVELEVMKATGNYSIIDLVMGDVVNKIQTEEKDTEFKLTECLDELEFIRNNTHKYIKSIIESKLDKEKLNFIFKMIEGSNTGSTDERFLIYRYLIGDLDTTNLTELLKNIELYE